MGPKGLRKISGPPAPGTRRPKMAKSPTGGFFGPIWWHQGGLEGSRVHLVGARGCILPIKWVKTYLGPDENPLGTNGKAVCAILGENFF